MKKNGKKKSLLGLKKILHRVSMIEIDTRVLPGLGNIIVNHTCFENL